MLANFYIIVSCFEDFNNNQKLTFYRSYIVFLLEFYYEIRILLYVISSNQF